MGGLPRSSRRKGVTGQPDSGRSVNRTSRLFGEGQAGNIALADDIFSESTGVNGVIPGVAEPKRRLQEPLAGFPVPSMHIVDMFSAGDKIVTRLVWRDSCPSIWAVAAARRPVAAAESPLVLRGRQSSGNIHHTGSVHPAKADRMPSRRDLCGAARASWRSGLPGSGRPGPAPAQEAVYWFPAVPCRLGLPRGVSGISRGRRQ
jgi:hypothetical protein